MNRLRRNTVSPLDRWVPPFVFGLAAWLCFPSLPARADLVSLLAGLDRGSGQWRMVLTDSPAGSIHQAVLTFAEAEPRPIAAGGLGLELPDGRRIVLDDMKRRTEATPDEERVNRRAKKARVVAVEPMVPPRGFTAGALQQHGNLVPRAPAAKAERTAFVKARAEKPMMMAGVFYKKKEVRPDASVSPLIAGLVTNRKADVLATAYAPPEPDFARVSPFDSILKPQPEAGRFVPPIGTDDHSWAANVLPPEAFSAREQQCLASGIYFEARGEPVKGQAAVAQVILNRVRNPAYPETICGVVYQNEDWRNRCQFSFACDNIRDRINSEQHWKVAREVALAVTAGKIWLAEVGSATHYHAIYVRPDWARTMKKVGRIGLHVFYRTHGGGWI